MKAHLKAIVTVGLVLLVVGLGWFWLEREQTAREEKSASIRRLPEFEVVDLLGQKISSTNYKGKVLIVNFWATWCGPCLEEVPSLIALSKAMGEDLRILAVSGDFQKDEIDVFLKSFPEFRRPGIDLSFDLEQPQKLAEVFGVTRLPESYIFGPDGKMVRKVVGSIDWASPDAIDYMKALKGPIAF